MNFPSPISGLSALERNLDAPFPLTRSTKNYNLRCLITLGV